MVNHMHSLYHLLGRITVTETEKQRQGPSVLESAPLTEAKSELAETGHLSLDRLAGHDAPAEEA